MRYIFSTLASAGLAAAHGYVTSAIIGGANYTFYQPYTDAYTSPTPERVSRPVQGNGPISDVTIADIQCGGYSAGGIVGSSPAPLHAPATAGSDVTLFWTLWPDSHYGALTTYMAKCPDTGCDAFMPNATDVWFKVAESGMEKYNSPGGAVDDWAVDSLMVDGNAGYTYTIPSCLADGYYLVRHEIIAVFLAGTYPGVQIFPGCHQLEVSGGGSTEPADLVAFPGAYATDDAGIVWDSSSTTYPIPGPTVLSCSGDSAAAAVTTVASAAATAAPTTLSTAVASSSTAASSTVEVNAAAAAPTDASSDDACSSKKRSMRHVRE